MIGVQPDRLIGEIDPKLVSGGLDQRLAGLQRRAHRIGALDRLPAQLDLALADAGYIEEIVGETDQMDKLPVHHVVDLAGVRAFRRDAQDIEPMTKRRQQIAAQPDALQAQLEALPVKLEEHVDPAAQDVGFDRLTDEVDGADLVAEETALHVGVASSHKNDGSPAGAFVAAHQFGQLETVETRRLLVDQRQRGLVAQQNFERLVA